LWYVMRRGLVSALGEGGREEIGGVDARDGARDDGGDRVVVVVASKVLAG